MAQTVEAFKKEWQDRIKNSPQQFLKSEDKEKLKGQTNPEFTVHFASDKSIQDHIAGKVAADVCCLVCAHGPFGIRVCVAPPGASCDKMCL